MKVVPVRQSGKHMIPAIDCSIAKAVQFRHPGRLLQYHIARTMPDSYPGEEPGKQSLETDHASGPAHRRGICHGVLRDMPQKVPRRVAAMGKMFFATEGTEVTETKKWVVPASLRRMASERTIPVSFFLCALCDLCGQTHPL
jgi:hypothetical protein